MDADNMHNYANINAIVYLSDDDTMIGRPMAPFIGGVAYFLHPTVNYPFTFMGVKVIDNGNYDLPNGNMVNFFHDDVQLLMRISYAQYANAIDDIV
jgi:hypothetical protein